MDRIVLLSITVGMMLMLSVMSMQSCSYSGGKRLVDSKNLDYCPSPWYIKTPKELAIDGCGDCKAYAFKAFVEHEAEGAWFVTGWQNGDRHAWAETESSVYDINPPASLLPMYYFRRNETKGDNGSTAFAKRKLIFDSAIKRLGD